MQKTVHRFITAYGRIEAGTGERARVGGVGE